MVSILEYEVYEVNHRCVNVEAQEFKVRSMEGCARKCDGNIFWLQLNGESRTCVCYQNTKQGQCKVEESKVDSILCSPLPARVPLKDEREKCKYNNECIFQKCERKWIRDMSGNNNHYQVAEKTCIKDNEKPSSGASSIVNWRGRK